MENKDVLFNEFVSIATILLPGDAARLHAYISIILRLCIGICTCTVIIISQCVKNAQNNATIIHNNY